MLCASYHKNSSFCRNMLLVSYYSLVIVCTKLIIPWYLPLCHLGRSVILFEFEDMARKN
uniref:Uncharacterized protein n=1 Tax=Arundo donax TaxID=35708 RepID=A0A0A9SPW0_ARUDO